MRGALALLVALAAPAAADPLPPYPPAGCAALWEAYADLFGDSGERALAARFRDWSIRLDGEAATDAAIAEHRPMMTALIRAYVQDHDRQSRDLFERLVTECGTAAGDLPGETP